MKLRIIRNLFFLSFLFFVSSSLFSDIKDARDSYRDGDLSSALVKYRNWLQNNRDSEDITSVLFEVSELKGDIKKICEILEPEIIYIKDIEKKTLLYERLAQLYELSSNIHYAQLSYQNAALSSIDSVDYRNLLKSARLLLLEGDLLSAEVQLKDIITNSPDKSTSAPARQYYEILKILSSTGDPTKEFPTIENPSSLYLSYLIAEANSDNASMEILKKHITEDFSLSPEAKLLLNKILTLPNIFTSFGLLKSGELFTSKTEILDIDKTKPLPGFIIQAGSFRNPENAHFLSLDIQKEGFSPVVEEQIINNIKYYKVIMYFLTEDNMQKALKKLNEKGFEGFPVY